MPLAVDASGVGRVDKRIEARGSVDLLRVSTRHTTDHACRKTKGMAASTTRPASNGCGRRAACSKTGCSGPRIHLLGVGRCVESTHADRGMGRTTTPHEDEASPPRVNRAAYERTIRRLCARIVICDPEQCVESTHGRWLPQRWPEVNVIWGMPQRWIARFARKRLARPTRERRSAHADVPGAGRRGCS